jgi:hypothetical protein
VPRRMGVREVGRAFTPHAQVAAFVASEATYDDDQIASLLPSTAASCSDHDVWPVVMVSIAVVLGCGAPRSTHTAVPATFRPSVPVPVEVRGPEIRVVGSPAESVEALRHRVEEAFAFALRENGWSEPRRIAADPLEVVVTDPARGTLASASGPHRFSVSKEAIHAANSNGVFAHELTHVQDFRVAGSTLASIPRYLVGG